MVLPVVYLGSISGITNDIPLDFSGKTVVMSLKTNVLPVVIPPKITADFHW